jgi:tRNA nucleotidyltransferase/poly(A) polymerase
MKQYLVGGAVRDQLLGRPVKDRDFVVVGATEQEMLDLGFEKVGASFPVFLKNGEEYALARTERKIGAGYNGFTVVFDSSVTLEDDLIRRDLTINAMAIDPDTGALIDPYGGQHDLAQGVLRHVSDAFAEDPIRVLRTARFAARYGFKVADSTLDLMKRVVHELVTVPKERIWAEFEKGLMEDHPVKMFEVLHACGALDLEVLRPYSNPCWGRLARVTPAHPMEVRFAVISKHFDPEDFEVYRIPTHLARVSRTLHENAFKLYRYYAYNAADRLDTLVRVRALADVKLLDHCMEALAVLSPDNEVIIDRSRRAMYRDLEALAHVDNAAVARTCTTGPEIADAIRAARIAVMSC